MSAVALPARVLRGTVVWGVAVALMAGSHTLLMGLPEFGSWTYLFALGSWLGFVAASAREWSLPRLIVALTLLQVAGHTLLEAAGPCSHVSDLRSDHLLAQPLLGAVRATPAVMLVAHAGAVVATALILRIGERLLLSLWALGRRLTTPLTVPAVVVTPLLAIVERPFVALDNLTSGHCGARAPPAYAG